MDEANVSETAVNGTLAEPEVRSLFVSIGFSDWQAAYRSLSRLTVDPYQAAAFRRFLPHLVAALATAAGPDRVLVNFERFVGSLANPLPVYNYLADNPRAIEILVTLFSASQFLTEILFRTPDAFERLVEYRRMARVKSRDQIYTETQAVIAEFDNPSGQLDALRRYQSAEMLRIGACDLLDLYDLPAVVRQLSNLADSLIRACVKIAAAQSSALPDDMIVIGMGKLGGRELNYSSDIDLLFLARTDGATTQRLGQNLIDALARVTSEGFLYRVDMRLRPWGRVGPLVSTIDGFLAYLEKHARPWEKQALLKARWITGDQVSGSDFLERIRPFLFQRTPEQFRVDLLAMKQQTEAHLRQNGRHWGEVKLGEGSIRDVEFTVQYLQLAYGSRFPEIIHVNTLESLSRLAANHLLSLDDHRILAEGYIFLRTIEHHLQMMHYRQTHTLPQDTEAIAQLARRLGFRGTAPGEAFLSRYEQHGSAIRSVYLRYIGGAEMPLSSDPQPSPPGAARQLSTEVSRHLQRMSPSYSETFSPEEIARHAQLADSLNDRCLVAVDAVPQTDGNWLVTVVAHDFPGELSLICGLMFVHGMNIISGDAFTYEPLAGSSSVREARRKIVDVFMVNAVDSAEVKLDQWTRYAEDLTDLLRMVQAGQQSDAQGKLAKQVATSLQDAEQLPAGKFVKALYPIEIQIDNEADDLYTILRIESQDTFGFLYELTNALALDRVYIARVIVGSTGHRAQDLLFVTDENGNKITDPNRQRELRAATVLIKHFTHLLPFSPNPESALLHFREFIGQLFQRTNWPDELASLERPVVLHGLARLLGVSDFLWDDFLRMQYVNLFPVVRDVDALSTIKSREQLQKELEEALRLVHAGPQPPVDEAPWIATLNAFKDREMFRIDMRHILGHTPEFWEFAYELSDLAEVVVNSAYHLCHEDLRLVYGSPRLEDGSPAEMSVLALGKFGGREMGFASDIELMFVYSGNGQTSGPQVITTAEFYEKVVVAFSNAIRAKREGIFEIDLQLRPYGKAGSLSVSLEAFRRYFAPEGPAWAYERQALVKLRPVAGNPGLGRDVAGLRDRFVYTGESFDVTAMRAMRERQVHHLVVGGTFHPKFSLGGLVDIEYLIQGLQIMHGSDHPDLRLTNTREAMSALEAAGILTVENYTRLRKAHTFFRWLIDSLRVVRGNAKDVTVPRETSEEFAFLARRMRYGNDVARLRSELVRYTEDVRELNLKLLR